MENELKYEAVKNAILNQIHNGELKAGDKLPSDEEYMKLFQVSGITIRKALTELANDGYIVRIKRKGTFISESKQSEKQSHLIAMILSAEDYYDSSYMKIIKGAQKMAAEYNYSLIVEWSNENLAIEQASIQKMLDRNVDGFLIYPFDPIKSIDNFKLIEQRNIPYVLVDRYNLDHPCYFAGCNNHDGAMLATRELLRLKHTKIKFAAYHFFLNSEQERYNGYCSAMHQAGLPVNEDNLLIDINYDSLVESIHNHEITALFCSNDKLAVKIMKKLLSRDVRIPQDVSVIGFDDWDNSRDLPIALSTVKQVFEDIGQNGANLLINAILGKIQGGNAKILSGVSLVMRDSTSINPYA